MPGNDSTADELLSVGAPLARIARAEPLEGRLVRVIWASGAVQVVDLAPALLSRRIYQPLRDDDALFSALRVSDYGNAIEWSDDLDFSAAWLSKLPPVEFDNAAFRKAMDELGMTLGGMAAALEISRRQVAAYRNAKPIPKSIAYATRYLVETRHRNSAAMPV